MNYTKQLIINYTYNLYIYIIVYYIKLYIYIIYIYIISTQLGIFEILSL